MCLSLLFKATILQLFSTALCQFPMQFPFPQMVPPQQVGMPNMAPMAPIPPLAPQTMFLPPMNFPMSPGRMPTVVKPYYSRRSGNRPMSKYRKKRRKSRRREDSYESGSESRSAEHDFRRRAQRRRQVLTPVVSYVTKEGYVVYQKKIKKDKAKDWLEMSKKMKESQEMYSSAEERKFQKMMRHKKKRRY